MYSFTRFQLLIFFNSIKFIYIVDLFLVEIMEVPSPTIRVSNYCRLQLPLS
jgi:hypothetical protein